MLRDDTRYAEKAVYFILRMHKGWEENSISSQPTHRSGPRVYRVQDGDYTQKIEDKDGKITFPKQK